MLSRVMRFRWVMWSCLVTLALVGCGEDDGDGSKDTATSSGGADTGSGADAQTDTSADTGGMQGCGGITFAGQCDGAKRVYCEEEGTAEEALVTLDCAEIYPDAQAACVFVTEDYGYDCGVAVGETCTFRNPDGSLLFAYCDGEAPGCVLNTDGQGTCQANVGQCSSTGMEDPPVYECLGEQVVFNCRNGQPGAVDCAAANGTCNDNRGACIEIGLGGTCNVDLEAGFFICGAGLRCIAEPDQGLGVCEAL